MLKLSFLKRLAVGGAIAAAMFATARINAQNLTLEGQTGGFITPTAYVVYIEQGSLWSHPAVGYHFVNASSVIGYVHTFTIEEGFANRAEFGYTRSVHYEGNSPVFSSLWDYSGMNVFNAKVVAIKDGQFGPWTPGLGGGFVVRTGDKFVSGALNQELTGTLKSYTNEDVYVAATKTWLHPPVPFLLNFGLKVTNASIYRARRPGDAVLAGGSSADWVFRFRSRHNLAAVPAIGFTQEPPQVMNLERDPVSSGQRSAHSDHDGLRGARDAEGQSALCV